MKKFISALVVVVALSGTAQAQDLQKGLDAYAARDYATALLELTPLAEQGAAEAQYILGNLYGQGKGVARDHRESSKFYRMAAGQAHGKAQASLGSNYWKGLGVPKDIVVAYMWFTLASANGNEPGRLGMETLEAHYMSADEISEARTLMRTCVSSNYQNCGY
ncbi:hypothetical protein RB2150_00080 [Rhodobacterales bacterium HTCC2150]|nr:hypothetical protein RB2150_00080 [Rhodobacterales bacterium HTCC2150] [Rhodobacteraceae bacterium HTCC2150]